MIEKLNNTLLASAPRESAAEMLAAVREAIHSGQLRRGDRLMPLRQLAEQYGVSFGTVSTAVGQLEREGLVAKRPRSGTFVTYDPHRAGVGDAGQVHMWLPLKGHVYQHLVDELLMQFQDRGIEGRPTATRPMASAEQMREQVMALTGSWQARPPRALVVRWDWAGVRELVRQGVPAGVPVIVIMCNPHLLPRGWHSVNPDSTDMCRRAVDHLVKKGHRRFGLVTYSRKGRRAASVETHPVPLKAGEWSSLQTLGMQAALWDHGLLDALDVHHNHRIPGTSVGTGGGPMAEANIQRAMHWLQRPQRPTAIVGDDARMFAIKQAAERLGLRVPKDLELVGFGDTPWSEAGGFSTVSFNETVMAQEIASLIDADPQQLGSSARHVMVLPRLVVR